jgi:hypothetical protein
MKGDDRGLTRYESRVSSQNGEDGVIAEILVRIGGPRRRWFVEFGASTGDEGNCVLLADRGWSGLFMEPDAEAFAALEAKYRDRDDVITRRASVTADNVEELLAAARTPPDLDVVSIDIDGNDYWIWERLVAFAPRVVVIEYNANLPLDRRLVMPRDDRHAWDGTDYVGASLGALRALGKDKGYELVHTESTGVNAFFVRGGEATDLPTGAEVPLHRANYFGAGLALPRDPLDRPFYDLESAKLVRREPAPGGAGRGRSAA